MSESNFGNAIEKTNKSDPHAGDYAKLATTPTGSNLDEANLIFDTSVSSELVSASTELLNPSIRTPSKS